MTNRVLLVNPPFHAFFEYNRWWYAFSCAQLAGCLREKGMEAFVYDGDKYFKKDPLTKQRREMVKRQSWYEDGIKNNDHYIWRHFRKTLEEVRPDVVGVTMWSSFLQSGVKILEICKEFDPAIKTCVGGYHVSAMPGYFRNNPLVDAVFAGPADNSLPDWIAGGCREKFIRTDPRGIDIKKIPAPSRESLLYPEFFTPTDMGMVMTSRGCPSDCAFCSNKLLTGLKYQFRTTDQVRLELEHIIEKYHVPYLNISDANFLADRKNALQMAELFKTFAVPWGSEGLINSITEELVLKLIDCGCTNLSFGIESGSQARLDKLKKRIRLEQIEAAAGILNKCRMKWKTFFIVGFPDDTPEEMELTRRFALKINPSYISLNSFTPLPGTDIYNEWFSSCGDSFDLGGYNQLNPKADFIKSMDTRAYREKFNSILDDFERHNESVNSVNDFKGVR
ncbi:MAG: radical SAM protein [Elusimicrobiales bacterium]|jgi:radical SAM superfamily enzyme YgiQ (UPF0313 family)